MRPLPPTSTGADQVPAVKETLGRISAQEAMIAGMVNGQINAFEDWPGNGYVCFNRRIMYAALEWCTQNYSKFVDELRELMGGGRRQPRIERAGAKRAGDHEDFQRRHQPNRKSRTTHRAERA